MFSIALVIISGFFHALWNVIAKHSTNKVAFLIIIQCVSLIIFLIPSAAGLSDIAWSGKVCLIFLLSMILHGTYFILLSRAYHMRDISQVYPIIRGSSTLIVPLLAITYLQEKLSLMGWAGIVCIVVGIFSLGEIKFGRGKPKGPTMIGVMIGCCVASYILIDKYALAYTNPLTINWIGTIGNIIALSFFVSKKENLQKEWKKNTKWILAGSILAPLSYLIFLYATLHSQIAQLAPIREIGTIFGVALGALILKEPKSTRRIISSILVTFGIILLGCNK